MRCYTRDPPKGPLDINEETLAPFVCDSTFRPGTDDNICDKG